MEPLDILHKFLISNKFEWMKKVFLHPGGWSVAANHSCLMAFRGEIGEKIDYPPLLPILNRPRPDEALKVEIHSLLKWVSGSRPSLKVLEVDSEFQGVLAGVSIDLRKLAFILKSLPSSEIFVWDSTLAQGVKSMGFECGSWRGCLAGVDLNPSKCSNVFEVEVTPIDLMLELESE
jgi:hypothetical protein